MTIRIVDVCARALRLGCAIAMAGVLDHSAAAGQSRAPSPGDEAVYSPWTKFCGKEQNDPAARETCLTIKEARLSRGSFVVGVALIESEDGTRKVLRITLPAGIDRDPRVAIEQDQPVEGRPMGCLPQGCMADFDVDVAFVTRLRAGHTLTLSAADASARRVTHAVPLAGFASANEGPPTDPNAFEVRQREIGRPDTPRRNDQLIRCGDEIGAAACARKRVRERDK